jgi:hypothetical protein
MSTPNQEPMAGPLRIAVWVTDELIDKTLSAAVR